MATIRKSVESLATPGILRRRTGAEAEKLERPLEPGVASVQAIGYGKFALATVGACLALLMATLLMNVLVDPFAIADTGLLPTAVEADRTVKLDLIRKLARSPDIVILGSSRARQAEPSFLAQLTGETAFNAAVTGGTAADAWVMARYVTDRFPRESHHYIWFVDAGIATKGINPQLAQDPRAKRYLAGKSAGFTLADAGTYIGPQARFCAAQGLACLSPRLAPPPRLRRRRRRGHPPLGRVPAAVHERDARQPPQHAPAAPLHRRPFRRGAEIVRHYWKGH